MGKKGGHHRPSKLRGDPGDGARGPKKTLLTHLDDFLNHVAVGAVKSRGWKGRTQLSSSETVARKQEEMYLEGKDKDRRRADYLKLTKQARWRLSRKTRKNLKGRWIKKLHQAHKSGLIRGYMDFSGKKDP